MSKKTVDGIEVSDDIPVTEYDGKFSGTFDLDVTRASKMAYDDTVYFVVTSRLDSYSFKPTKFGDLKRVNTFKIDSVRAVTETELNRMHQGGYVEYDVPERVEDKAVVADELFEDEWEATSWEETPVKQWVDEEVFSPNAEGPQTVAGPRVYKDPVLAKFLGEVN